MIVNKLVLLTFLLGIFIFSTQTFALSCGDLPSSFTAIHCDEGICRVGFKVENVPTGSACEVRPTVQIDSKGSIYTFPPEWNQERPFEDGIYEVKDAAHLSERQEAALDCREQTCINKISSIPSTISSLELTWKVKEVVLKKQLDSQVRISALKLIIIQLVVLLWPWLSLFIFKVVRKHQHILFLVAIVIQLIAKYLINIYYFWTYDMVRDLAQIFSFVVVLMIAAEIIYLVYLKLSRFTWN